MPLSPHSIEPWRALSADERLEYVQYVTDLMVERQIVGRKEHGDTFQGDPLKHLEEELVDGLFYCWEARRERDAMRGGPDIAIGGDTVINFEGPPILYIPGTGEDIEP